MQTQDTKTQEDLLISRKQKDFTSYLIADVVIAALLLFQLFQIALMNDPSGGLLELLVWAGIVTYVPTLFLLTGISLVRNRAYLTRLQIKLGVTALLAIATLIAAFFIWVV